MPLPYAFTPEQEADIVARYQAGETCQSLGASFGLGTGKAIKRVLEQHGVFTPNRYWTGMFSPADRANIVRRYQAGETQRAIAASYGCTGGNVRALLIKQGVFIRPQGVGPIDPRSERILRQMRSDGATVEAIARHLSVPQYRVRQWVKELGLPTLSGKTDPTYWKPGNQGNYRAARLSVDDPLYEMTTGDGVVLEHRLVMARSLGRPLKRSETVHHINGDRQDNRLENLQLRQGNHGQGSRFTCLDCGSHNVEAAPI